MLIFEITGRLTGKQREKMETLFTIANSLHDKGDNAVWRTFKEIREITDLSKGAISKHLRDLIKRGVVKGEVRVKDNRLTDFFTITGKSYELKGKIEDLEDSLFLVHQRTKEVYFAKGIRKKAKGGKTYRKQLKLYKVKQKK